MMKNNFSNILKGAAVSVALLSFVVVPVYAQSARDLDNRINRLENEIDTLSRTLYRGESERPKVRLKGSVAAAETAIKANAEIRIQQLEIELRKMTGQIEQQSFEIRKLKEQIARLSGDVNMRLGDIERAGAPNQAASYTANPSQNAVNPAAGAESPQDGFIYNSRQKASERPNDLQYKSQPASAGSLGTLNQNAYLSKASNGPAAIYENAFSLLKASNYGAAEKSFDEFLKQYPSHSLAGNAQYWLGETFYVRGKFEEAARIFAEGYQKYPQGTKAPDNLLKLGLSLANTGNKGDACVALRQLKKQYSKQTSPVVRRSEQEIKRLGC